jgi:hypothetical protein
LPQPVAARRARSEEVASERASMRQAYPQTGAMAWWSVTSLTLEPQDRRPSPHLSRGMPHLAVAMPHHSHVTPGTTPDVAHRSRAMPRIRVDMAPSITRHSRNHA